MPTTTIPWAGQVPYGQAGYGNDMLIRNGTQSQPPTPGQYNSTPFGNAAANNNWFMNQQAVSPFMQNLPGYQQNVAQRGANTYDMLRGEIPGDAVNLIAQQSAERGIGSGVAGSPNSSTALLRALGLTSLDMMGRGSQELSQSIADTPQPELFNPASLWAPEYNARTELGVTQAAQQRQQADAQRRAAAAAWNANRNDGTFYQVGGIGPWLSR